MRVLVVGSGGREHALCWKISKSPLLSELFCAPGNPGTAELGTNVEFGSVVQLADWACTQNIGLTIVGPEAPLAAGLADEFLRRGLKVFGPVKAAARLESSKSFAKEVMLEAGVPTPGGRAFDNYEEALLYLEQSPEPLVVKADGLAAGKGVLVPETKEEAQQELKSFMCEGRLGGAGSRVVLEEKIRGAEASLMAIIAGDQILPLAVSQDYKRLLDDGMGPNTGGMGAISPTKVLSYDRSLVLSQQIFKPVVEWLKNRGIAYCGFLYAGLIIDEITGKEKVLEFNVRLGDPETQVLMLRMESDLLDVLNKAASGESLANELLWSTDAACCVVATSRGYPEKPHTGDVVNGLFSESSETVIFQAGTAPSTQDKGQIITSGGRILCVSARAGTLDGAVERAYAGIGQISFEGMHYRRDIGR